MTRDEMIDAAQGIITLLDMIDAYYDAAIARCSNGFGEG